MTVFEVLYYNGGPEYAPNRCVGRDYVRRHDLTDALKRGATLMLRNPDAHGVYVRKAADQSTQSTVR